MADVTNKTSILSVCATIASRLQDLEIKDGNLIFIQDIHRIALDFGGKRVFYNQIEELATDADRLSILAPVTGSFYFVINTAILWTYQDGWVQLTTPPEEIVYIGTEMPELGSVKTLYINKSNKEISVWDDELGQYIIVADKKEVVTESDIDSLFTGNE